MFEVAVEVWNQKLNILGVVGGKINSDHWKWTGLKNVRYEVEK